MLQVNNLKTWLYSGSRVVRAVDDISFHIRPNETLALLGESGSGKSMTALSIARLLPEVAEIVNGQVRFEGKNLLLLPEADMRDVRGRRIAMIFQEPATSLNPVLTVGEQIIEVLSRHKGLNGKQAKERTIELLKSVKVPDAERRFYEYPFQLSGGLKQRVMIAAALAAEPSLLLADEPTTALDVTIQAQVLELLGELQKKTGMGILLITHDMGVVAQVAHTVALMYAGHIVELAPREDFFKSPKHPYARKLFSSQPSQLKRDQDLEVIKGNVPALTKDFPGCRFADRCDFVMERCHHEPPKWTAIENSHVRCHLYSTSFESSPPMATNNFAAKRESTVAQRAVNTENLTRDTILTVSDLKVHFPIRKGILKRIKGYVKAVDGVSFEIKSGQTLALVGESGSGKTTVGKSLLQLIRPTSGSVRYQGQELTALSQSTLRKLRSDLQIIFQDPYSSLNPRMRVFEILEEGMAALSVGNARERRERVITLLNEVGLDSETLWRYPHEFSGGQRQRIAIARALAVNPKLIVCDEPTSALDISVQAQILNLLKRLQKEKGLSYLFITHNMGVVEYLAHEVAVMYLGRIVEQGSVQKVLNHPIHPYTQTLLSAVPTISSLRSE